jgi:hypothetical protein
MRLRFAAAVGRRMREGAVRGRDAAGLPTVFVRRTLPLPLSALEWCGWRMRPLQWREGPDELERFVLVVV